jgi:hypothetical protein
MREYCREKDAMQKVMFKDSFYILRFVEIFSECIKKTHNTLPYILRNQYKNAEVVFKIIQNVEDEKKISTISHVQTFGEYYRDVVVYIISPLLKRHGVYSPNIVYMIMIDLYMHMLGEYFGCHLRDRGREFLRSYVMTQTHKDIDDITWMSQPMKEMMKDELDVWRSMKRIHHKRKV